MDSSGLDSADSENELSEEESIREVRNKAVKLLTRREYSQAELTRKLIKDAPSEIVHGVLSGLANDGYQSDERFAEMVCRTRFNNGKGPVRIRHELNEHQVRSDIIESCLSEYDDLWRDRIEAVRSQKFGAAPPESFESWAKQARFLQQRGFTAEQIGQFRG